MTRYGLAQLNIFFHSGRVNFDCTVPEVTARLLAEVRAAAPDGKVSIGTYGFSIDFEKGNEDERCRRASEFAWWIMSWLCFQGWEPYAYDSATYSFRLRQGDGP